jgi:hypothetical protein
MRPMMTPAGADPPALCRLGASGRARPGAKTRLKKMQYRPALLDAFMASTRLDLTSHPQPSRTGFRGSAETCLCRT